MSLNKCKLRQSQNWTPSFWIKSRLIVVQKMHAHSAKKMKFVTQLAGTSTTSTHPSTPPTTALLGKRPHGIIFLLSFPDVTLVKRLFLPVCLDFMKACISESAWAEQAEQMWWKCFPSTKTASTFRQLFLGTGPNSTQKCSEYGASCGNARLWSVLYAWMLYY